MCTPKGGLDGRSMFLAWYRREMYIKFLSENLKRRDHLGYLRLDSRIILKWILKVVCLRMWTGFIWIYIRSNGDLF
jgi:hypothetical protein